MKASCCCGWINAKAQAGSLEAKAGVARAVIALEDAERELARTQELFDRGLIANEELKDAELLKAAAEAELESAKAKQAAADVLLERTELRAPFDGIIVEQNGLPGRSHLQDPAAAAIDRRCANQPNARARAGHFRHPAPLSPGAVGKDQCPRPTAHRRDLQLGGRGGSYRPGRSGL